jgi:hypothetical protein
LLSSALRKANETYNGINILEILVCFSKVFLFPLLRTVSTPSKSSDLCVLADIQWVPEDRVTLFTSDGLIQIGGSLVPRRVSASEVLNLCNLYIPYYSFGCDDLTICY